MSPKPRKHQRNLPSCVYQKHGAYWYVKRGKWTRLGTEFADSLAEYARLQAEPTGGMSDLIDRTMKALERRKKPLSKNTLMQYRIASKRLKRVFAEFAPQQVKPKHVAAFKGSMADKPNMCNRCLSLLRQAFAYAVEWQEVDSNPCIGILRHEEEKRDRYITDEELEAIYSHAGARLQVVIDLCYLTAQRISDVLTIRRADLTAEGIRFAQRKTGAKITVAWTPELEETVARAKGLGRNVIAMTLLYNRKGKALDYRSVKRQWDDACKAAGVKDAHLHDLRAKSLTDADSQGSNATALAGHASEQMTKRYLRLRRFVVVQGPRIRQGS